MGKLDEAIADYSHAIQLDPKYVTAYNNRGLAYQAEGNVENAFADYARSMALDPHHTVAYRLHGFANFDMTKFDAAASDFAGAVQQEPNGARQVFWLYLARSRIGGGNPIAELQANATKLKRPDWPYPIVELFLGDRTPAATLAAANGTNERCEAQFYVGEWHVLRKDGAATDSLKAALDTCPKHLIEYSSAQAELKRLLR
jgi:lipoprotein NlpI